MGGTCSRHVVNEKCVKTYSENRTRVDYNLGGDGKVILQIISNEYCVVM
jgi:hypothetical protein